MNWFKLEPLQVSSVVFKSQFLNFQQWRAFTTSWQYWSRMKSCLFWFLHAFFLQNKTRHLSSGTSTAIYAVMAPYWHLVVQHAAKQGWYIGLANKLLSPAQNQFWLTNFANRLPENNLCQLDLNQQLVFNLTSWHYHVRLHNYYSQFCIANCPDFKQNWKVFCKGHIQRKIHSSNCICQF